MKKLRNFKAGLAKLSDLKKIGKSVDEAKIGVIWEFLQEKEKFLSSNYFSILAGRGSGGPGALSDF